MPITVLLSQGDSTVSLPTGAANLVISAVPTTLRRITVTVAGTAAAGTLTQFFDNATTNSGTVVFSIPGNAAAGTFYDVSMPCLIGLVGRGTALSPVCTVSFDGVR